MVQRLLHSVLLFSLVLLPTIMMWFGLYYFLPLLGLLPAPSFRARVFVASKCWPDLVICVSLYSFCHAFNVISQVKFPFTNLMYPFIIWTSDSKPRMILIIKVALKCVYAPLIYPSKLNAEINIFIKIIFNSTLYNYFHYNLLFFFCFLR